MTKHLVPRLDTIRRGLFLLIIATLSAALGSIAFGKLTLFVPPSVDPLASCQAMLTTLVQVLAAVLGISLAVLFLTAQTSELARRTRSATQLLRSRELMVALGFFTSALITGILTLARSPQIVRDGSYEWIDVNIAIAIASFLLLLPVVLSQMENMDPVLLGTRFAKRVTVVRIQQYGLASVTKDPTSGRWKCALQTHSVGVGVPDPLGPFHEVVMRAVDGHDRLLLVQLVRLLLDRVACLSGGRLPSEAVQVRLQRKRGRARFHRPASTSEQLAVTLHVLHYVVRRAWKMREEWGGLDVARHPFVSSLSDLIAHLASTGAPSEVIVLCEVAVLRICLAFAKIPAWGTLEPLTRFADALSALDVSGYPAEAEFGGRILGVLGVRTTQTTPSRAEHVTNSLPSHVMDQFRAAEASAQGDRDWLPNMIDDDPWATWPI